MGGNYVTCAGVDSKTLQLFISDPWQDAFEAGLVPGRSPIPPSYPHPSQVHNDTLFVSHDGYTASFWMEPPPSPYPGTSLWELLGYLQTMGFPPSWHAFIRAAIVTSPLHDIAVIGVETSKTGCTPMPTVGKEMQFKVNATIENKAGWTETFTVEIYANSTLIGSQAGTLNAQEKRNVTVTCDTSSLNYGGYTISALGSPVLDETNNSNNSFSNGTVYVVIPGDIDGDGAVGPIDLGMMGAAWGSFKGDPNYNQNADLDDDENVGPLDLGIMGAHWGEMLP